MNPQDTREHFFNIVILHIIFPGYLFNEILNLLCFFSNSKINK